MVARQGRAAAPRLPPHLSLRGRVRRPAGRLLRRLLVSLSAAVLLFSVGGWSLYTYARHQFNQIQQMVLPGLAHGGNAGAPMTVLLVGSNSRAELDGKQANTFGSAAEVGGARSDVTMLLHIDPAHQQAALLSIPRDLFLPVPAYGHLQRVDAALNKGAGQLVDTIQQDLGIPIDHYVELNFNGFQNVINALGGVNMYFPAPLRDAYSSLNITRTGCQHLDGFQALAVVRARHLQYYADGRWQSDPLSDLSRIRRDHEFLKVLFTAVKTKGLSNPVTANTVLGKLVGQIKLDSSFSFTTLVNLATRYSAVNPNTVPVTTLPISVATAYTYRGADYGDIDLPVEPDDQATITRFLGTPPTMTGPAGVTVDVADTSHIPGQAHQIAIALQARGYTIPTVSIDPVDAHPAETVISYPPGSLPAAQKLKADLAGPVMLGQDSHLPAGTLHLAVGTNLTTPLTPPATRHGTAAPTAEATNSLRGPVTSPNDQLASFDPTACPGQP